MLDLDKLEQMGISYRIYTTFCKPCNDDGRL